MATRQTFKADPSSSNPRDVVKTLYPKSVCFQENRAAGTFSFEVPSLVWSDTLLKDLRVKLKSPAAVATMTAAVGWSTRRVRVSVTGVVSSTAPVKPRKKAKP